MAEWRTIPGYEGYEVSDDGRVRNRATGYERKQRASYRGYMHVGLSPPGPRRCRGEGPKRQSYLKVHRLVAIAFIPNPDSLPEVNHKDCCKTNNAASNLEWVDRMGNYWHAHAAGIWHGGSNPNRNTKFSRETIAEVRSRHGAGAAVAALAAECGMARSYCNKVVHGRMRKRG